MKSISAFFKKLIQLSVFLIFSLLFLSSQNLYSQYKRAVVFEEFTEVWCGPCASLTPMLTAWLKNHPSYIPVLYTSYFKINSKNVNNNKEDYDARNNVYSVPFYPYARVNGVMAPNIDYPGFPTDTSKLNNIIDTMASDTPVNIILDFVNNGVTGKVNVSLTSAKAINNVNLYVMIVEKEHEFEKQPNGLTHFHDIFRDMLPVPEGKLISIKAGETLNYSFDYNLPSGINLDLYAVALLQDTYTRYIYQGASQFKSFSSDVNDFTETSTIFYPNPISAGNYFHINTENDINDIKMFDLLGVEIAKFNDKNVLIPSNTAPGIYFIKYLENGVLKSSKIIVE